MDKHFLGIFGARRMTFLSLVIGLCMAASNAIAQAPATGSDIPAISTAEMDKLVAPIALYPDDLVAIILPASTFPLEIVQAARFLEKRTQDKSLQPNANWNDSVKSLANYPDVINKMNADLDWTADLGEAVVADQSGVLEAVQRFRRQVQGAGNLKSDDKQTVIVEKEVIKIVQANPEVIYVPQYNPSTIVVSGGYPYAYYPAPYPVYYYPYPPGAVLATGLVWGAAIGAAWNGGHWGADYEGGNNSINIDNSKNFNSNRSSTSTNARGGNAGQGTAWKSDKKPGQVSSGAGGRTQRVGDRQAGTGSRDVGGGAGSASRPGAGTSDRGGSASRDFGGGGGSASRPSAGTNDRGSSGSRDFGGGAGGRAGASTRDSGGSAFSGSGAGRTARADSSRGASSRQSMSGARGGGGGRSGGGGRGGRR